MKKYCKLAFLLLLGIVQNVLAKPYSDLPADSLADCKAYLKNNELVLENNQIRRIYKWNNGNLIPVSLASLKHPFEIKLDGSKPDCTFPGTEAPSDGNLVISVVPSNSVTSAFLKVEVSVNLGQLQLLRVFKIYPNCPAIACDYYLKGACDANWGSQLRQVSGLKNLENSSAGTSAGGSVPIMQTLNIPGVHWKVKAVQLFDVTDYNNNLVQEVSHELYRTQSNLKGNILFAENLSQHNGFFILKEAPCTDVQIAYPGYDFGVKIGQITIAGIGVNSTDIQKTEWTRCYGVVTGIFESEEAGELKALHSYLGNIRKHLPNRDEMIMMNTWGDRNQDKKVGEEFVSKELYAAKRLGITHFQIDDGWQSGRSANSAAAGGSFERIWNNPIYWTVDPHKFPHGLKPLVKLAGELGINLSLWFNPSKDEDYLHWKDDAAVLIRLYKEEGIKIFKIDGVSINSKLGDTRLRKMFDTINLVSNHEIVLNLDVTAGRRYGYHYFNEYGNLFLENRYTDWHNYYPHWTLRNLWMLSRYVPASNLQVEFLNNFRNADKYEPNDELAPSKIPFEYTFATTMIGQPLAWMEATGLPEKAFGLEKVINIYKNCQSDLHSGTILPVGDEPSGYGWTGFQSINQQYGYFLIFRENNKQSSMQINSYLLPGCTLSLTPLLGEGKPFKAKVKTDGTITFSLPHVFSFALYKYRIIKND